MPPRDDTVRMRHMLDLAREAVGRVSGETQAQHGDLPWGEIVGLRNRLIHGYDSVDMAIVWEILTGDLPPLIETLQGIPGVKESN